MWLLKMRCRGAREVNLKHVSVVLVICCCTSPYARAEPENSDVGRIKLEKYKWNLKLLPPNYLQSENAISPHVFSLQGTKYTEYPHISPLGISSIASQPRKIRSSRTRPARTTTPRPNPARTRSTKKSVSKSNAPRTRPPRTSPPKTHPPRTHPPRTKPPRTRPPRTNTPKTPRKTQPTRPTTKHHPPSRTSRPLPPKQNITIPTRPTSRPNISRYNTSAAEPTRPTSRPYPHPTMGTSRPLRPKYNITEPTRPTSRPYPNPTIGTSRPLRPKYNITEPTRPTSRPYPNPTMGTSRPLPPRYNISEPIIPTSRPYPNLNDPVPTRPTARPYLNMSSVPSVGTSIPHPPPSQPNTQPPKPNTSKSRSKWKVDYTIRKVDQPPNYSLSSFSNDRMGKYLMAEVSQLHPVRYLAAANSSHRPYYDHYRVYYNNSYFKKHNVPRVIHGKDVGFCKGSSERICPNASNALCLTNGTVLCVANWMKKPCSNVSSSNPDSIRKPTVDVSPNQTCLDTWSIPCYNYTKVDDQCNSLEQNSTALLRLRCLQNIIVDENLTLHNNTIVPTYKASSSSGFDPLVGPLQSLGNSLMYMSGKDLCVVIIARPWLSSTYKANKSLLPGAQDLFSRFAGRVFT